MWDKTIVKDYAKYPYYVQWAVWCWRKPVFVRLPLCVLLPVVIVLYSIYLAVCLWCVALGGEKCQ